MLLRCYLIHHYTEAHFTEYLVYLCQCLGLGPFLSYLCDLFSSCRLIFFVIGYIISFYITLACNVTKSNTSPWAYLVQIVPDRAKYLTNMILWKLNSNPQSSKPTRINLFMLFILPNLTFFFFFFLTLQPFLEHRLGIISHLLENSDLPLLWLTSKTWKTELCIKFTMKWNSNALFIKNWNFAIYVCRKCHHVSFWAGKSLNLENNGKNN